MATSKNIKHGLPHDSAFPQELEQSLIHPHSELFTTAQCLGETRRVYSLEREGN